LELAHAREAHLQRGVVPLDGSFQFSDLERQPLDGFAGGESFGGRGYLS
jgi:hypothetical protein